MEQSVNDRNSRGRHVGHGSTRGARSPSRTGAPNVGTQNRLRVVLDLYRIFGPHLKPYRSWFFISYASMAVTIFLLAARPYPLKWILDYVLLRKQPPKGRVAEVLSHFSSNPHSLLLLLCITMVALVFLQGLFSYAQRYMLACAARYANNDIRNHVFHRLQILSLSFHNQTTSGDLMLRLTDDINQLRKLLIDSVSEFLRMFLTFGWIMLLMFNINWQLTLLAMVVLPFVYFSSNRFTVRMEELTKVQRSKESKISAIIQENVSSMAVVQAFTQEDQERRRFAREANESLRADVKRLQLSKAFSRVIDLVVAIGTAVVLYCAGTFALNAKVEATALILFVPWLKELYSPMGKFSDLLMDFSYQLVCGERIAEILRAEVSIKDAEDAIAAPRFRGSVHFDGVTFGYTNDRVVLDDMTFTVHAGQTVALVGSSGAGKSTIANLLLRFYDPWRGAVLIDDHDIRHFTLESYRSQMSVVPQDTILFHRTIRENVAYGKPEASPEEITRATCAAEIHDFITQLPNGYDTVLEEGATNLSGGQKQRLALARGILRDTPILILDEPVTQLDPVTEARLNRMIARVTKCKTTFIIAHRLSTIQRADLILVIDRGKVVEQGTHSELMARSSFYRNLYETQYVPCESVISAPEVVSYGPQDS